VDELQPEELRDAFKLHFYSDDKLNRDQIAKLLGLSSRTASRLIARAKDELAERVMGLKELLS
jgi:DNA-directed RNA polymerase specialized sigma24 family protein